MTRLVVGPFNRVEGDLEVTLDVADGRVAEARVTTPLYRGFEQILIGREPADALVIAPRICGICSVSQSMAAAAALRGLSGVVPAPAGVLAANLAHAAENIADHLTHFYLFFMPDFARYEYAGTPWFEAISARFKAVSGSAAADVLPARANLLHVLGIIAGKWPHSLAFQPGGTTRAIDLGEKMRLITTINGLRGFLEKTLYGAPLEEITGIANLEALHDWSAGRTGDFARFLTLARALRLDNLGHGPGPLMSFGAYQAGEAHLFAPGLAMDGAALPVDAAAIREDVGHSWLRASSGEPLRADTVPDPSKTEAYGWAKAPRYNGRAVEVGALARQVVDGSPLAQSLLVGGRSNVAARVIARLVEVARIALAMEDWARALPVGEPFCQQDSAPRSGDGVGLVEAARGSLGHFLRVESGRIAGYQIIAPTTWNFSPRDDGGTPGPLEQALVDTDVGPAGAKAAAIQHIVRSFDPCMVCTAH